MAEVLGWMWPAGMGRLKGREHKTQSCCQEPHEETKSPPASSVESRSNVRALPWAKKEQGWALALWHPPEGWGGDLPGPCPSRVCEVRSWLHIPAALALCLISHCLSALEHGRDSPGSLSLAGTPPAGPQMPWGWPSCSS